MLSLGVLNAGPALAARSGSTEEALAAVPTIPSANVSHDGDSLVASDTRGTVTVPDDPNQGVSIATSDGAGIRLTLPGAGKAKKGRSNQAEVVFDGGLRDAAVAVRVEADGVQALGVISSSDGPQRFEFGLTTDQPDGHLFPREDGGLDLINGGLVVATVQAAWAHDADLRPVPTFYDVSADGKAIIQTVKHRRNKAVRYPVVFDPKITFGWATSTVYFNKSETREMSNIGGGAAICGVFGRVGGPIAPVLVSVCATRWFSVAWQAMRARDRNMCLKVKFFYREPWTYWWPDIYSGGNCR